MGEVGWVLLAFAIGLLLATALSQGARAKCSCTTGPAARPDDAQTAPQVTSVTVGDDDVLIFECGQGSHDEWLKVREFFESSIVGRFPKDLPEERRRRAVIFPPGWKMNVLHIKRRTTSNADGKELVEQQGKASGG